VAVGTTNGGYLFSSNGPRKTWKKSQPFLKGESVNNFAFSNESKSLYAATLTEGVFLSKNLGKTWTPINRGLNVRKTWTVAVDENDPDSLYVGTQYGHLFHSKDNGGAWEEVTGLHSAPKRANWGVDWAFGTTGLCIHTIRIDPRNSKRLYIIASGNGLYRSDDAGATWQLLQSGVKEECPVAVQADAPDIPGPKRAEKVKEHLETVHSCTHKLVVSQNNPKILFQQNHCGVYASKDYGEKWVDVSPANWLRHGFPIVMDENGHTSLFVIPAFQGICKSHNSCIKEELAAYTSDNSGKSWKKVSGGLPRNVHTCVLRDSMAGDGGEPGGLYFGTTTGELFGSTNRGAMWSQLSKGLGRIQGVVAFAPN
jgi:hypothetical protein